jgi:hypothetical protein
MVSAAKNQKEDEYAGLSNKFDEAANALGLDGEARRAILNEEARKQGMELDLEQPDKPTKGPAKASAARNEISEALKTYKPQPQAQAPAPTQPVQQAQPQPQQATLGPQGGPGFGGTRPELFAPVQPSQVAPPQENVFVKQVAMMRTEDLMKLRATERNPSKQRIIAMELQKRQQAGGGL